MRRRRHTRRTSGAAALLLACVPFAARAENAPGIFGVWATQKNHGRVEVFPCEGRVCARILDGDQIRANPNQRDVLNPDPAKRSRRVLGLLTLQGYAGGPTQWNDGTVYDPQTGDGSSNSTLSLVAPGILRVEGCVVFLCRSETWTKLSPLPDRRENSRAENRSP